ncbi:MAG: serine/threonine protein kinase, partial [Polyangiaceae bacterium]|nr:serine/threonine protein kinase [Polyangiaceae bacterium]
MGGADRDEGARRLTPPEARSAAETRAPVSAESTTLVAGASAPTLARESLIGTLAVSESVLSVRELAAVPTGEARYLPLRELGHGGMGRVDAVFDRALGRPVAQKTPIDAEVAPLLVVEAQIGAQLEHPSIVPVYDVGRDPSGRPSYTMRVVNGRTLRDVLDAGRAAGEGPRRGLAQLLGILRQVCLAVDYAHSRGVVHRDLKPENVIVGEFGEVYVLDWGVAYLTEASDIRLSLEHERDASIAGSPGYMAPEQALGGKLDGRADVYALGVILYEMLAGRSPFEHERDLSGVVARMVKPTVPPPSVVAPGSVPTAFDEVVRGCLRRNPDERVPGARAIVDAIDRYLDAERERVEREREADARAAEGAEARRTMEALEREAAALGQQSEARLAELQPWEPTAVKEPLWELAERARRLEREAARERARAESAFTAALSRVPDHAAARAGLAALHFREFLAAEEAGDATRMAQHLELARSYDDGPLALELADEGALEIELVAQDARAAVTRAPVELSIARYEARGMRLVPGEPRPLECGRRLVLGSGSDHVRARRRSGPGAEPEPEEVRYPLVVERAKLHKLRLRWPLPGEVPEGMVLVPGGPFLALPPGGQRLVR